jgi:Tfp pilus assembly protein PilF
MRFALSSILICALGCAAQGYPNSAPNISDLQLQAHRYLAEQKPQLAIPVFRQIVSLDPKNIDAQGNLGVLLFFQNNYAEAIPAMRAALMLQSNLWKIQALLGVAEKRTGDLSAAQADLGQSFPNLDDLKIQREAGLELIEIRSAAGELDQAAAIVAKLGQAAPEDPQILFTAYQIASQTVERSLLSMALAAPNSAELHMMMADQFALQGDSANAIAQYREAIRLNSRLPGVHFELAGQLKDSPNPTLKPEAEHEFQIALAMNQYDEKSWRELGELIADKGDFKGAKEDFLKALSLSPRDSIAETDLGELYLANDDIKTAISVLENAVKDDPTNSLAHYQLRGAYQQAGRTADAKREAAEFTRFKSLRDKLGTVFRQFRQEDPEATPNHISSIQ